MNLTLNMHKQIWIFLVSLLFCSILPAFMIVYLSIIFWLVIFFSIVCVIDFIRRTAYRKKIAYVIEPALFACIVSMVVLYFTI
jgi:hypothetical protein